MKKRTYALAALMALLSLSLFSCDVEGDNKPTPNPNPVTTNVFHVVMASGSESPSTTLLQATEDPTKGELDFNGKGYTINTSRAPHLGFPSDASYISVLYYRDSKLERYVYDASLEGQYRKDGNTLMFDQRYGKGLRFKQVNDQMGSVHEAIGTYQNVDKSQPNVLEGVTIFNVAMVDMINLKPNTDTWQLKLPVTLPEEISGKKGYVITRADSPVVDGKYIYYGINIGKFDPKKPDASAKKTSYTGTLVLDYPSLTNPRVILHEKQLGATNGYRSLTMFKAEDGYTYQLADTGEVTSIIRLKDGKYDNGFQFNLTEKLNIKGSRSVGWFYVGNGVGYIPYENQRDGMKKVQRGVNPQGNPTYSYPWGIARMDFKNGTIVDLEVPEGLWLQQYQSAAIRDGKIYFALASFGKSGHICIYDIKSANPKPTLGTKLSPSGADQYYIGIF